MDSVLGERSYICLYVKDKQNIVQKENLIDDWFRMKAEIKLNESLT